MQNISNDDAHRINNKLNRLFMHLYKTKPSSRLNIQELNVIYPRHRVKKLDIKYLKNIKSILDYYFANIDRKPFINPNYNFYAFEILWILLTILNKKIPQKPLFSNASKIKEVGNNILNGRYVFTIPKYKQYIFDVKDYNLAKLKVV
jgi:ADP-glucose pyrophosphorylase